MRQYQFSFSISFFITMLRHVNFQEWKIVYRTFHLDGKLIHLAGRQRNFLACVLFLMREFFSFFFFLLLEILQLISTMLIWAFFCVCCWYKRKNSFWVFRFQLLFLKLCLLCDIRVTYQNISISQVMISIYKTVG